MVLEESDIQRINEIKFYEICNRIYSVTGDYKYVLEFLKDMTKYFEFNLAPVIDLAREILDKKYIPTKKEIIMVAIQKGHRQMRIRSDLHVGPNTVSALKNNPKPLYPRGSRHFYTDLQKFIDGYEKMFEIDYNNIILKKENE